MTYADLYYLLAASMKVILKSFKEDDERIHMNALQFLNHGLKAQQEKSGKNQAHKSTYAYMNKSDLQAKKDKLMKRINAAKGAQNREAEGVN